jgi:peptidoglycan/xylan/chitin deacetylase (PgdA/CDA1 family)
MAFGVPRSLLQRGDSDSRAAIATYLADPERLKILRALDERWEAWDVRPLRYPNLAGGPRDRNEVLLTFDDGPNPETTPQILDILRREQVPAVFFVVGHNAERYPTLVKRAAAEGHTLANHTWDHGYLTKMEPDCALAQVQATRNAIQALTGVQSLWFRPPGGHYDSEVVKVVRQLGLTVVLWTDNPSDWLRLPPHDIESRALRHLTPGGIVLLHDTIPETVAMLPDFIRQVKARGFQFVPIARWQPYIRGK